MNKRKGTGHKSDCALHNGPAFIPGECSCGAEPGLKPEDYPGAEWPAEETNKAGVVHD